MLAKTQNKKIVLLLLVTGYWSLVTFLAGCATVPRIPAADISALKSYTVSLEGIKYVPLTVVCDKYDFKWSWDIVARKAGIQRGDTYLRFLEGSNFVYSKDDMYRMEAPARLHQGILFIPASFVKKTVLAGPAQTEKMPSSVPKRTFKAKPIARPAKPAKIKPIVPMYFKKVVIDPGHGGKDPGAIGRGGLREKDVVLDIAGRLKRNLEAEAIEVVMTRTGDSFVSLQTRAQIANREEADLFISIHANASRNKGVKGFEVYYLSDAADESAREIAARENASLKFEDTKINFNAKSDLENTLWDLVNSENKRESKKVSENICREARRDLWVGNRGVKSAGFYVLKGVLSPSVLIEVGFISNSSEEKKLNDSVYRDKIAEAIVGGVLKYRDEYELTEAFTK